MSEHAYLLLGVLVVLVIWQMVMIEHVFITSLLIGVDEPHRTPHCIRGRFFYLIPEADYNRVFLRDVGYTQMQNRLVRLEQHAGRLLQRNAELERRLAAGGA